VITEGLFTLITGNAALAALIEERCYPVVLPPEPTLPALTYQVVSQIGVVTGSTEGPQRMRIQFDAFGASYGDADSTRDALRALFLGMPVLLSDGTELQNAIRIQSIDYFDDDPRRYRCMSEFYLWFDYPS
jgi:hypothetical protein